MKKIISPTLLLLAALIWGFAFSAQKALSAIPVFTLTALRSIIAGLFLLLIIPCFDKFGKTGRRLFGGKKLLDFTRTECIGGISCGIVLAVASLFQQAGLSAGTDAGKASFITALYVVLVPVLGLLLKKHPPITVWISVMIAVVGFYFLCIKDGFSVESSDLLVLACAFVYASHILVIDRFSPNCDGVRMSCIQFFTCTVICAVLALIFDSDTAIALNAGQILPLLYIGIGSSGLAYTFQILGQKGTDPTVASILMSLESVFGVIGGMLILGELMSVREAVGCAIVFAAVLLAQFDIPALIRKRKADRNNTN
ncbi:MAG: DMT family transporter [Clostridia bacterium]|nr:DMT family transporter [Clostridia bacterium]